MENNYLISVAKQFEYYKMLGEKTFSQLKDEDMFWKYSEHNNSIAVLVNHLHGNMLSRWTDFLTSDGEKAWRTRDVEFEDEIQDRTTLLLKWDEGWACLFQALETINMENFNRLVYIRNEGHTIVEAINRQLAHYAYHIGQVVFIGTLVSKKDWKSLSIPKGNSSVFNETKFSQDKGKRHFTDGEMK